MPATQDPLAPGQPKTSVSVYDTKSAHARHRNFGFLEAEQDEDFGDPISAFEWARRQVGPGKVVVVLPLFYEKKGGAAVSRKWESIDGGDFALEETPAVFGHNLCPTIDYLGDFSQMARVGLAKVPLQKTAEDWQRFSLYQKPHWAKKLPYSEAEGAVFLADFTSLEEAKAAAKKWAVEAGELREQEEDLMVWEPETPRSYGGARGQVRGRGGAQVRETSEWLIYGPNSKRNDYQSLFGNLDDFLAVPSKTWRHEINPALYQMFSSQKSNLPFRDIIQNIIEELRFSDQPWAGEVIRALREWLGGGARQIVKKESVQKFAALPETQNIIDEFWMIRDAARPNDAWDDRVGVALATWGILIRNVAQNHSNQAWRAEVATPGSTRSFLVELPAKPDRHDLIRKILTLKPLRDAGGIPDDPRLVGLTINCTPTACLIGPFGHTWVRFYNSGTTGPEFDPDLLTTGHPRTDLQLQAFKKNLVAAINSGTQREDWLGLWDLGSALYDLAVEVGGPRQGRPDVETFESYQQARAVGPMDAIPIGAKKAGLEKSAEEEGPPVEPQPATPLVELDVWENFQAGGAWYSKPVKISDTVQMFEDPMQGFAAAEQYLDPNHSVNLRAKFSERMPDGKLVMRMWKNRNDGGWEEQVFREEGGHDFSGYPEIPYLGEMRSMVPMSKQAAAPIRIGYQQAEWAAGKFLDNADIDERGVIVGFQEDPIVLELVGPTGELIKIRVEAKIAAPDKPTAAFFHSGEDRIEVFYNDLLTLASHGWIKANQAKTRQFKVDWDSLLWNRTYALAQTILHELTHAVDPTVRSGELSEGMRRFLSKTPSTRGDKEWRGYFDSPEEFRARLQEAVYEASILLDTCEVADRPCPNIFDLLKQLRAVWILNEARKNRQTKLQTLNRIYAAIYEMMVGRDLDPRTGKKIGAEPKPEPESIPMQKNAGNVVPIGNQTSYQVEIWVDGQFFGLHKGPRAECWALAKKQAGPGRRVVITAVSADESRSQVEQAQAVADANEWPADGFLKIPAGIETEFKWASVDGKPFGPPRMISKNRTDTYVLGGDGRPRWFDTDYEKVGKEVGF